VTIGHWDIVSKDVEAKKTASRQWAALPLRDRHRRSDLHRCREDPQDVASETMISVEAREARFGAFVGDRQKTLHAFIADNVRMRITGFSIRQRG
jgi:hypothetical protein